MTRKMRCSCVATAALVLTLPPVGIGAPAPTNASSKPSGSKPDTAKSSAAKTVASKTITKAAAPKAASATTKVAAAKPAAPKSSVKTQTAKAETKKTAPQKVVASAPTAAAASPVATAPKPQPQYPAPPADLHIRIIGTASFQGKQTALVEDLNTLSDSFYKVGDPIYGYNITAIGAEGIHLERDGQKSFVAFETTTVRTGTADDSGGVVVANTYLPESGSRNAKPNFYSMASVSPNFYLDGDKAAAGKTQWDLFTPKATGKTPALAGDMSTIASAATGLFGFPLASFKRLSSGFGYRKHPIGGGTKMHKGLDLSADRGTRIRAADAGTVTWAGWKGGYGYCIIIDHHNGYETLYGHCSKLIADVGDNVRRNDLIAEVGSTGASTGNHLHFEVHKNGTPVDPEPYIAQYL